MFIHIYIYILHTPHPTLLWPVINGPPISNRDPMNSTSQQINVVFMLTLFTKRRRWRVLAGSNRPSLLSSSLPFLKVLLGQCN